MIMQERLSIAVLTLLIFGCEADDPAKYYTAADWNDSMPVISAITETSSEHMEVGVDAADDPAIWINYKNPGSSRVVGTNKRRGLSVHDLNGKEVQFIPCGRPNNVDVIQRSSLGTDIAAISERENNEVVLFTIDSTGRLSETTSTRIKSGVDEVYGICLYQSRRDSSVSVLVNGKNGVIEDWQLSMKADQIDYKLVNKLSVASQPEGMVVDPEREVLYVGEEDMGIWKFDLSKDVVPEPIFVKMSGDSNENIKFDIEGLSIYDSGDGIGYLLASSQGNNSFAVFELEGDNRYVTSFRVAGEGFDDTRDTDGISIVSDSLSPEFARGMLVVQDGASYENGTLLPQNFKYVPFSRVFELLRSLK